MKAGGLDERKASVEGVASADGHVTEHSFEDGEINDFGDVDADERAAGEAGHGAFEGRHTTTAGAKTRDGHSEDGRPCSVRRVYNTDAVSH